MSFLSTCQDVATFSPIRNADTVGLWLGKTYGQLFGIGANILQTGGKLVADGSKAAGQSIYNSGFSFGEQIGQGLKSTANPAVKEAFMGGQHLDTISQAAAHHMDTISQAAQHVNPLLGAGIAVGAGVTAALGLNALVKNNRAAVATLDMVNPTALQSAKNTVGSALRTAATKI